MIQIAIPGHKDLHLEHLVLDYNGTLAVDGQLIGGAAERLTTLAEQVQIHVLTADTFGQVKSAVTDIPCRVSVLPPGQQAEGKLAYVQQLGVERVVCIGNGRNDRLMLAAAALGIAVIQAEGIAVHTMAAADVVAIDILTALDLLVNPLRLVATLRS